MEVYILRIFYLEDGDSTISLHTTSNDAERRLVNWVYGRWEDCGMDEERSGRWETDVTKFFSYCRDDYSYSLHSQKVHGLAAEETPVADDEVVLTPDEVKAVITALEMARPAELAHYMKMSVGRAAGLRHTAHSKLEG